VVLPAEAALPETPPPAGAPPEGGSQAPPVSA
jgi:hypothetical protein